MRSRTQNDIYISTNDFAKGIPIFFSSDGTVSTVSTDHFKQESLGTKHISIQGSRFNGIYKRFSIGLGWPDDGYQWEVSFQRYLQIILKRCVWVRSIYQFRGLVSTVSTTHFR